MSRNRRTAELGSNERADSDGNLQFAICDRLQAVNYRRRRQCRVQSSTDFADGVSSRCSGFTLVEMLIVVTIVGILASVVIPTLNSTSGAVSLEALARALAADIRLARQSAVQYNSDFVLTLNLANNSYSVAKASGGAVPGLASVLAPSGAGNTVDLDTYGAARMGRSHVVIGGAALKKSKTSVTDLTFKPTGGTGPTRTEDTVIWLAENTGANRHCMLITVSWITGAVSVGDMQAYPANLAMPNF